MKLSNFCLAALLLAPAACATATSSGNEDGDSGPPATKDAAAAKDAAPKKSADASLPQNDDAGVTTDDSGAVVDDSTCGAVTTKASCEQCCIQIHPTGYGVYQQELDSCLCTSPGACATQCASEVCANQPTTAGDACETCINAALVQGTGACYDGVASACQADVDCTDLFGTCIPPCESK